MPIGPLREALGCDWTAERRSAVIGPTQVKTAQDALAIEKMAHSRVAQKVRVASFRTLIVNRPPVRSARARRTLDVHSLQFNSTSAPRLNSRGHSGRFGATFVRYIPTPVWSMPAHPCTVHASRPLYGPYQPTPLWSIPADPSMVHTSRPRSDATTLQRRRAKNNITPSQGNKIWPSETQLGCHESTSERAALMTTPTGLIPR
eukprot:5340263-Pyramimonas_sp.AAC.1